MKNTLVFWAVNFVPVSTLLAIFEIWLEEHHKHGPWGKTEFNNPYWEEKMGLNVPFLQYLSRYHLIMFLIVMPILFCGAMWLWSTVLDYEVLSKKGHWYSALSAFMLFGAIWLGNSGLEDFLYFLIQSLTGWHEPHALWKVVIEKDHAWFKDWLPPIFGLHIPGHWVFCPIASLGLLIVREHWVR